MILNQSLQNQLYPLKEHAKWFPRCGFLQGERGAEFVLRYARDQQYQLMLPYQTQRTAEQTPERPGLEVTQTLARK